jgi:hypothetical protein
MSMTTDARVRSNWATFEPSTVSRCRQPRRQGAPPLEYDVEAVKYADFTKEYGLHHERITLPTTFNAEPTFPTLYLIAARMLPILVSRVAFRATRKRIYR